MDLLRIAVAILLLSIPAHAPAQNRAPVIDVHLHAQETPLSYPICAGVGVAEVIQLDGTSMCKVPLRPSRTALAQRRETLAAMRKYNITGVISWEKQAVFDEWKQELPERVISAYQTNAKNTDFVLLKQLIASGKVQLIGEVTSQYAKLAPNDPALDPLYALAQELDVPLGIHVAGIGAGTPGFRAALGDPLLLEEVPLKYPRLRLYVMHAGYPFGDRMISLLRRHPQVYVDISLIDWQIARSEFHAYLKHLVDNGFGKRIMFGTDQVSWPSAIGIAIHNVESAPFLSQAQKRDIMYNNAARFLRIKNSPTN